MEIKVTNSNIHIDNSCWELFLNYIKDHEKFLVVLDKKVAKLYKEDIQNLLCSVSHSTIMIENPEAQKEFSALETLTSAATQYGLTNKDAVLAIGGGATLDLVGLFSSIYKRGTAFYSFPTTLLSQVDSAIGGKTAINFKGTKNVLGSFFSSKAIFIDPKYLATLSEQEYYSGLGEIIKYAFLDQELFHILTKALHEVLGQEQDLILKIIRKCVSIKQSFVDKDFFDDGGVRIALNMGHTLGHLIENKEPYYLNHGLSVMIGLDFALFVSLHRGLISEKQFKGKKSLLNKLLNTLPPICLNKFTGVLEKLNTDKKFAKGQIQFVVPLENGYRVIYLNPEEFAQLFQEFTGVDKND